MAFNIVPCQTFPPARREPVIHRLSGCKNEKGGDLAKRHVTGFSKPVKEQDILKGVYKDPCKHGM